LNKGSILEHNNISSAFSNKDDVEKSLWLAIVNTTTNLEKSFNLKLKFLGLQKAVIFKYVNIFLGVNNSGETLKFESLFSRLLFNFRICALH